MPRAQPKRGWGGILLLVVFAGIGVTGWLMYSGRIAVPAALAGLLAKAKPAAPAPETKVASRPPAAPEFAPPPPDASPAILLQGMPIENYRPLAGNTGGLRLLQRENTGELITLVARPVADTVGEPAEGEMRLDSIHGDTTTGITTFQGYVVTLRGSVGPTTMRELLHRLAAKP